MINGNQPLMGYNFYKVPTTGASLRSNPTWKFGSEKKEKNFIEKAAKTARFVPGPGNYPEKNSWTDKPLGKFYKNGPRNSYVEMLSLIHI